MLVSNVKDFLKGIPAKARVSQFPYEGGLVRKDLLILTIRTWCKANTGGDLLPPWCPATYDLSTEFHFWQQAHCCLSAAIQEPIAQSAYPMRTKDSKANNQSNLGTLCLTASTTHPTEALLAIPSPSAPAWIIKPAQGHRCQGHSIITTLGTAGCAMVAQLVIEGK